MSNSQASEDYQIMIAMLGDSKKAFFELSSTLAELMKTVTTLVNEVKDLKLSHATCKCQSTVPATTYADVASKSTPGPQPSPTYLAFLGSRDVSERTRKEKDSSIVLVGFPETPTEDILSAVRDVLAAANIPAESVSDDHRHGPPKQSGHRIVKVRVTSMDYYRRIKLCLGRSSLCRYSRNDLTRTELDHDRHLRSWCHNENSSLSLKKFMVVDLRVVEVRDPKPYAVTGAEKHGRKVEVSQEVSHQ